MDWLTGKITELQNVLQLAFIAIVIFMAVMALVRRKLLDIILLFVSVGILGWLVFSTQAAVDTAGTIIK